MTGTVSQTGSSGSSGTSGTSGNGGSGSSAPSAGVPTLSASGTSVSLTAGPTDPAPQGQLTVSVANPPTTGLYYLATYTGSAVVSATIDWSPYLTNGIQTGNVDIVPYDPVFIGSGTFHDTVTITVCTDSKCANPIAGSPISVAVTYTVTGNAVSDATYAIFPTSLSLESKSTDPAPSTTINVTAYEVPPYGAYVSMKSVSGGPVASMSFAQTSGNPEPYSYATGTLTVNMKTPATLGPGTYNDVITLSICYDAACTKPAAGSPYSIPVTYLITAAAGREFQEQIIQENLVTLAVDPTGTTLYGATEATTVGTPIPSQLVSINPVTGAVTTLLTLPTPVSQIVVSSDGAYLYLPTNSSGPPQVMRVRTSDMTIDQTVTLPNGFDFPAQVAVSPTNSNTWSVYYESLTSGVTANQVAIYDGTVPRPNVLTSTAGDSVWSGDASSLYVVADGVYSVPVSANGLGTATLLQPGGPNAAFVTGGYVQLVGGLLYGDSGQVLDPVTNTIVGQYILPSGVPYASFTVDPTNNRVFACYGASVPSGIVATVQSFNLATFAPIWIARLPIGSALRWGSNGLAGIGPGATFGTQALYLINGSFVAP
jgi:hypothetical protein